MAAAADLENLNPNPTADPTTSTIARKRKQKASKNSKRQSKKQKLLAAAAKATRHRKPTKRVQKILDRRAKNYHSDSDDDDADVPEEREKSGERHANVDDDVASSGGSEDDDVEGEEVGGDRRGGVMKYSEGCRAFKVAFLKIIGRKLPNDPLGPILAADRKLVAAKLAEEVEERKAKGQARKEKQLASEKGHVKPESYLDEKEKFLISVATKGVVRLFNAVSKAQSSRGLNPSRSKDAKALAKQRKQAFLSELQKSSRQGQRGQTSSKPGDEDADQPGWAPLRDSYMLSSKLKDWDKKMPDSTAAIHPAEISMDNSSDEE